MVQRQRLRLLVTVKAYPQISEKYHETVCVAGVRVPPDEPGFVRLYPVPYRYMDDEKQFRKYDIIEVDVARHASDARPESFRPDMTSLQVVRHVDSSGNWRDRLAYVDKLIAPSMCEIQRRQAVDGTSLGLFRPKTVQDFILEAAPVRSPGHTAIAAQGDLFNQDRKRLEALPYRFMYRFRCHEPACRGHRMGLLDWEVGASYLQWRRRYTAPGELEQKIRQKWLTEMTAPAKDLHFFTGNIHQHPGSFVLLGAFYPPRDVTSIQSLF